MLSERARIVLNILVDQYVHTASPVASEEIARLSTSKISPATVRNAVSQLTEEGYISRPHVSAGGIPSDLGYRCYVESLSNLPELPAEVRRQIRIRLGCEEPDVQTWSQQCASVLSHMTANLALVTVPRARSPRLRHIELVYLQEFLALLIIVLQEARLLRRLLSLEDCADQVALDKVAGRLNGYFGGKTASDMECHPLDLEPLEERVVRDSVKMMREAETHSSQEHYIDGLPLLPDQPEFSRASRAKELVELLEQRVILETVLSEMPTDKDVTVHIGGENRREELRPFAVVICDYGISGQIGGTICVIGPTRMGYAKAMSGVRYLASHMSRLLQGLHKTSPAG